MNAQDYLTLDDSIIISGDPGLSILPGGKVKTDPTNRFKTGTLQFQTLLGHQHLFPTYGSEHPYEPFLWLANWEFEYGEAYVTMNCNYAGFQMLGNTRESQRVYSLHHGVVQIPIECHPNFVSRLAGTAARPLNLARFVDAQGNISTSNKDAKFDGWAAFDKDGKPNESRLQGVEVYDAAHDVTWREQYTTTYRPNVPLSGRGKKGTPNGNAPKAPDGLSWIDMGLTYDERLSFAGSAKIEGVYTVSHDWVLKFDPNALIYGS